MSYPVNFDVEQAAERNRLTTFFRLILAIPHLILVGGPIVPAVGAWVATNEGWRWQANWSDWGGNGLLAIVVGITVFISWFAILFTGRYPDGLYNFAGFYLRWRANAVAYISLLRDEYPPFGEDSNNTYPVRFELPELTQPRDRVSVFFRLFLLIPHVIAIFFVSIAYWVVGVIAWFAVLFTGQVPDGLFGFMRGYLRWQLRFEAYALLLTDKFPPFNNWEEEPGAEAAPA